ncbi:MAG: ABC transporter ATPase [Candidatus Igneacidithiobacillus chanchocoensis]
MKIIELIERRGGVPTSTVHQARLQIFQPTRRPVEMNQVFQTAWGEVRIKGRLGQQHADLLEAIMHFGTRPKDLGDGRIKLLVDPHQISIATRLEGATLRRGMDDLMQAIVEIKEPAHLAGIGHLIDHVDFAKRASGAYVTAPNPLGGERRLWKVEMGKALCRLIESDLWQRRDPRVLSSLRHGISQAVVRHVLSHRPGTCEKWPLNTLIRAVAGDLGDQAMRDRRRELRDDAQALAVLGVRVEQKPGSVEQKPGSVEHKPGAWSINPDGSGSSGSSGA